MDEDDNVRKPIINHFGIKGLALLVTPNEEVEEVEEVVDDLDS